MLCCRVSPKQKAEVVKLVMKYKNNKTTLAIGDGANDVNMITAAHIGIGISGLEGQQAARAADYSIGQFRFLRSLLFVHGREAYRRNSYLIQYMFYKNVVYVIPLYFFGSFSQFSGTQIYDTYLYNFYNTFFTAIPIIWFSSQDWQFVKEELLTNPNCYEIGIQDQLFNPVNFWTNYCSALVHGGLMLWLTFFTFDEASGEIVWIAENGEKSVEGTISGSINLNGVFIFQAIVCLVNLKILIKMNHYDCFGVFWILGSIGLFYICFYWLNSYKNYWGEEENQFTPYPMYSLMG